MRFMTEVKGHHLSEEVASSTRQVAELACAGGAERADSVKVALNKMACVISCTKTTKRRRRVHVGNKCERTVKSKVCGKRNKNTDGAKGSTSVSSVVKSTHVGGRDTSRGSKNVGDSKKKTVAMNRKTEQQRKSKARKFGDYFVSFLRKMSLARETAAAGVRASGPTAEEASLPFQKTSFPPTRQVRGRESSKEPKLSSSFLPDCVQNQRFHVALPLLPPRMHDIFGRHTLNLGPPSVGSTQSHQSTMDSNCATSTCSFAVASLSSLFPTSAIKCGDEEALSCFFPAIHNGGWFGTASDFIEHCASVSHKIFCEGAPLFPLVTVKEQQGAVDEFKESTPPIEAVEIKGTSVEKNGGTQPLYSEVVCTGATMKFGLLQHNQGQYAYYWWFMRVHMATVQLGRKEWDFSIAVPQTTPRYAHTAAELRRVGELWCSYRFFSASVATGVAKRIVLSPDLQWHVLRVATIHVTHVVRDAYLSLSHSLDVVDTFYNSDERVMSSLTAHVTDSGSADVKVYDAAMNASLAVLLSATSVMRDPLSKSEAKSLATFSTHVATSIVEVIEQKSGVRFPFRGTYNTPASHVKNTTITEDGEKSASMLHVPSYNVTDSVGSVFDVEEEEHIMSLALWMYLRDAACAQFPMSD